MTDRIAKIEALLEGRYTKEDYPTLEAQFQKWSVEKPLKGLRVVDVTPLFKNTLLKYRSLLAAGAELMVGESSFISADKEVLEFCRGELGLKVVSPEQLADLSCGVEVDVVLDCAASYIKTPTAKGYVELTRSGIEKYRDAGVRCYAADSSRIKQLETVLGTGESFFRAMAELGYRDWKGKKLVVFGSGKVGRGITHYGVENGADVCVVSDPSFAIEGFEIVNYRDRVAVDAAVRDAYCVVMATGVEHALEKTVTLEPLLASDTLLANMGAEDEYGDSIPNTRTLCGKRTINFILDEPTHLRYIDATMSLHNFGAQWLVDNKEAKGVVLPSEEIEKELMSQTAKGGRIQSLIHLIG
ncbi:MAG: hypothetical protein R3Y61_05380 [Rikenellaceae bacterium]